MPRGDRGGLWDGGRARLLDGILGGLDAARASPAAHPRSPRGSSRDDRRSRPSAAPSDGRRRPVRGSVRRRAPRPYPRSPLAPAPARWSSAWSASRDPPASHTAPRSAPPAGRSPAPRLEQRAQRQQVIAQRLVRARALAAQLKAPQRPRQLVAVRRPARNQVAERAQLILLLGAHHQHAVRAATGAERHADSTRPRRPAPRRARRASRGHRRTVAARAADPSAPHARARARHPRRRHRRRTPRAGILALRAVGSAAQGPGPGRSSGPSSRQAHRRRASDPCSVASNVTSLVLARVVCSSLARAAPRAPGTERSERRSKSVCSSNTSASSDLNAAPARW